MKKIFLEKEFNVESKLGYFVSEDDYDLLIDEDCDVYKPMSSITGEHESEENCLIKFRKGVFGPDLLASGYDAFISAARKSENRGLAAGPKGPTQGTREWVYQVQLDLINNFLKVNRGFDWDQEVDRLIEVCSGDLTKTEDTSRGKSWLKTSTEADGFVFLEWAALMKKSPEKQQQESAAMVMTKYVSVSTYANQVNSGLAGYFDRYPRIPYCRETVWTTENRNLFAKGFPYIDRISELFAEHMPVRWANQKKAISQLDPSFVVGNSVFTTITVNKNYRTAYHRDAGDLPDGFGNIVALSKQDVGWVGGYLVFPRHRIAVNLRPGDYLLFDPHEIHGNTEYENVPGMSDMDRLSLVLYVREEMSGCELKLIEDLRYKYVESRRLNNKHPEWRLRWNGISAGGMWQSDEWQQFLINNGLDEYVRRNFAKEPDTESLF